MSLPPAFLDELRARLSLARVAGRKVTWDARKSNPAKGDLWAPCPFHQEKTASFHVDDRKGYYYCFGCHAKGDAISFVRETENVGFMEAVEILAREAGMPLPARDPQAQARADRRTRLAEAVEAAVRHYRLQLGTAAAAPARDYLARRGLSGAALERFEIGFAPDARQGLFEALRRKGFDEETILAAGLCARPEEGGAPYDRFRGRIVFPIRDARGRAVSLGGRAMDPAARAKYLNGPETELFDKGRSLYNHGPAREAAGRGQPLILAEGYMDVIALVMAGFEAAVAPLGTAVTEDQLRLLWRMHPEPVVALDGDRAGVQAAMRLMDLALPLVGAEQSLRFALLPGGRDPDDLIREGGAAAMRAVLERAEPMVRLLWRRETEGRAFDSPERRATLDRRLRAALGRIGDADLRRHYGDELGRLRAELFGGARAPAPRRGRGPRGGTAAAAPAQPLPATRASLLAAGSGAVEETLREAVILATLLAHPALVPEFEGPLEDLDCRDPAHGAIRAAILSHAGAGSGLRAAVEAEVGTAALERLHAPGHVRLAPALRRPGDADTARLCLAEDFARLAALRGIRREVAEAMDDLAGLADEGLTWRLRQAAEAAARAGRSQTEDRIEYDVADNGLRLSRAERGAFGELLARIGHPRGLAQQVEGKMKKEG
ncbi:MAG: DNA primase [Rhodobacteraceae bacterium]|nr:DNA primase [Paracoccaceae bacterium]